MKRFGLLLAATALFTFSALAQTPYGLAKSSPILRGLQAYWNFEQYPGNVTSLVSADQLTPANSPTWIDSNSGHGYFLNQSSSMYLSCPSSPQLTIGGTQQFTIGVRVCLQSTSLSDPGIIGKWSTGSFEYLLFYENGPKLFCFEVSTNGTTAVAPEATTFGAPTQGVWYFVGAGWDGTNAWINVNGGAKNSLACTGGSAYAGTSQLLVGAYGSTPGHFNTTYIDDLGIWKRTLTTNELYILSQSGATYPKFKTQGAYSLAMNTNSTYTTIVNAGNYDAWPGLCLLTNGHMLCTYYSGSSHTATNGSPYYTISSDHGATWSVPTIVGSAVGFSSALLTRLNSGILAGMWDNVIGPTNLCYWTVSENGDSLTFTNHGPIPSPYTATFITASRITQLPNGKMLVPVYGKNTGDPNTSTGVIVSTDNGATWGSLVTVAAGDATNAYSEAEMCQRPNGCLYMMIRRDAPSGGYYYSRSMDGGLTWTAPALAFTKTPGYPSILALWSGRMLCATREGSVNEEGFTVSSNLGTTWSAMTQISTTGQRAMYQDMVQLPDHIVGIAYSEETVLGVSTKLIYQEIPDN